MLACIDAHNSTLYIFECYNSVDSYFRTPFLSRATAITVESNFHLIKKPYFNFNGMLSRSYTLALARVDRYDCFVLHEQCYNIIV